MGMGCDELFEFVTSSSHFVTYSIIFFLILRHSCESEVSVPVTLSINCLPFSVNTYFWKRELGLSGMVGVANPERMRKGQWDS